MNRAEFVREVFKFYGKSDDSLMQAYDLALSTKKNIDWDKLYQIVLKETESRYLPAPKWFIEKFDRCPVVDKETAVNDGVKIRVFVKDKKLINGYPYYYETFNNNASINKLKEIKMKELGEKFISMEVFNEHSLEWEKV